MLCITCPTLAVRQPRGLQHPSRSSQRYCVQVRGNLHMVSEIVSECVDYGIVTQLQLHVVLDRIHSRYLAPKRSLLQIMRTAGHRSGQFRCRAHSTNSAATLEEHTLKDGSHSCRSILPTENTGAQEVYVDLIEVVSCVIEASGVPVAASCQGTLQMKSYMSVEGLSAILKLNNFHCQELASQFTFMQGGTQMHCFVEDMQLHQEAQLLDTCSLSLLAHCHVGVPMAGGFGNPALQ